MHCLTVNISVEICYNSEELGAGRFASCRAAHFNNEHLDKKNSLKSLGMLYKAMKNLRGMDRVKINVMFALSSSCLKELHVSGNVDVGSLDDFLQHRGPATESLTKVFTKQILEGIQYLHDREITHGNLTCKNLLLGHQLNVRLTNFDAADTTTNTYKCVPSCSHETNERANTSCLLDYTVNKHKFDLWSVGYAVIQMLTLPCAVQTKDQVFNTPSKDHTHLMTTTPKLKQFLSLIFKGQQGVPLSASDLLQHSFITNTA